MSSVAETKGVRLDKRELVRRYPDTRLGPQLRPITETFSGYELLRQHFGRRIDQGVTAPSEGGRDED